MVTNFSKESQKKEINDNETWMWKRNTNIETWNVRSGTPKVLHKKLSKLDFDIVAFQETQLESGTQRIDNFTLFNSRSESKKHEFICRFYIRIFKICYRL
jgi:hypothetical protein